MNFIFNDSAAGEPHTLHALCVSVFYYLLIGARERRCGRKSVLGALYLLCMLRVCVCVIILIGFRRRRFIFTGIVYRARTLMVALSNNW